MGRIRILSDAVANQIAAGEVVERPASVVKELLENSLDAQATEIRVLVEAGGRRLIRIADDGHGMLRDDAMLAFERHATSKLSDVRDLLSIATLGFRGEALPSIASVSRLTLETRSAEDPAGTRIEIAGGKLLRCDEMARPPGTTISVQDLFYNVPARRKFLRSEQTELAHIASLVTHYSLAHPSKSFELRHGANELLNVSPVENLRERVYQVFGSQILKDVIEIAETGRDLAMPGAPEEEPGISRQARIRGFVSGPQVQKLNRNSIFLFVNGRLIRDKLLLHAISAAFYNLIPPACYPFALLFLDLDAEEVDVNVHPSKTEVRFRRASVIHDFVRDTIRDTLLAQKPVAGLQAPNRFAPQQPATAIPFSDFTQRMESINPDVPSNVLSGQALSGFGQGVEGLPEFTLHRQAGAGPRFDFSGAEIPLGTNAPPAGSLPTRPHDPAPEIAPSGGMRLRIPDTHANFLPDEAMHESPSLEILSDLRPLGQLHDSFIVAAGRDGLWLIDQHVAHERILFEQILNQRAQRQVEKQALLMPMIMELSAAQQIEYARIADELTAMGFETEPFGNRTIAIKFAPGGISTADIENTVMEVLEIAESEMRRASIDDVRRQIAASFACRAAIKINTRLDTLRMEWMLTALARTQYPMSCPHGRPIALRYSLREILRSFHRI